MSVYLIYTPVVPTPSPSRGKQQHRKGSLSWDVCVKRKWVGMEVRLQCHSWWLVSARLWGVVFYCVAIVSVIEVQLRWLRQYIHVQRDYRVLNVLLKKWTIADHRSLLTLQDMTVICQGRNQRTYGRKKRKRNWHLFSWARVLQVRLWWMRRLGFFLLWSTRDRKWPIAINVDQPKLLPIVEW